MAYEKEDMEVLLERYPTLLQVEYIECDIGWFDIIDKALAEILMLCCETGEEVKFVQIKEKFGGLRMYYDTESEDDDFKQRIDDCVYNAEKESYTTCEVCGEEGKVRKGNWIKVLCNEHDTRR